MFVFRIEAEQVFKNVFCGLSLDITLNSINRIYATKNCEHGSAHLQKNAQLQCVHTN